MSDRSSTLLLVPCPRCGGTGKLKPYKLEGDTEWRVADCPEKHVTAEPPSAWQPIETAPEGGKWVLLWWPAVTDAPFVGYCVLGEWSAATSGDRWPTLPGPTHWMPLPEGPTVTKSEEPEPEAVGKTASEGK